MVLYVTYHAWPIPFAATSILVAQRTRGRPRHTQEATGQKMQQLVEQKTTTRYPEHRLVQVLATCMTVYQHSPPPPPPRYWVVARLVTGRVRAHSCVHETCVRRFHAAWGVTVPRIVLPLARGCRVGVWFGFVRAALLPAVGTCVVLSFGVMPGWCCFLRLTHVSSRHQHCP